MTNPEQDEEEIEPFREGRLFCWGKSGASRNFLIPTADVLHMNKVILLGNGFDLAHGFKTRYCDFIINYLKLCLVESFHKRIFDNDLISIKFHVANYSPSPIEIIERVHSIKDLRQSINFNTDFSAPSMKVQDPIFSISCKSDFIRAILSHENPTWVDIESEYFKALRDIISKQSSKQRGYVVQLNHQLTTLGAALKTYLVQETKNFNISEVHESSPDFADTIVSLLFSKILLASGTIPMRNKYGALIVNYNYTDTVNYYVEKNPHQYKVEILNLHGTLTDDSLIFGFGHVENAAYEMIKHSEIKEAFDGLKMYNYIKTKHYSKLLRYIESDFFEVIILGHSCGKSDGTTMRMIFEHKNCQKITVTHIGEKEFLDKVKDIMIHCRNDEPFKKISAFDPRLKFPERSRLSELTSNQ
jgi:hypothetical protein